MEIRLLGPLEVEGPDGPITIGSRLQSGVLIYLALHAGRPVAAEVLYGALWGDDKGAASLSALRYHISKLRDTLEPGRKKRDPASSILKTTDIGYILDIDPGDVDAETFAGLVDDAAGRVEDDPQTGIRLAEEALQLWRGEPLAEVRYDHFAQPAIGRLQELHLRADLVRLKAMVALGRESEAIPELRDRVAENPYREDVVVVLMEALYRAGRHAEALQAATDLREVLGETLGLDTSPTLRKLEDQILLHAPELQTSAETDGPTNLPAFHNRFFGRSEEIAKITTQLARSRLVTLVGFGGIGKSRLGIEAAGTLAGGYRHGVWLAELASTRTPESVPSILAAAIGIDDPDPADALAETVTHLRERRVLLVIDNCEHVLDAVGHAVQRIIAGCPEVSILATSRLPLGSDSETLFPVGPLSAEVTGHATAMFVDRAGATGVDLDETDPRVIATCHRLGGIPLAIELAAAKLRVISLAELRAQLDSSFALLAATAAPEDQRHPTLEAVLDWSYTACKPDERAFLRQLSVFRGGFDLDAAAAVANIGSEDAINLLDGLVQHAFVGRSDRAGKSRFHIVEAIADFAAQKLDASDGRATRDRHAGYYIGLVADSYDHIFGAEQGMWFDRLDPEIANIREVLSNGDRRQRAEMAAHSWRFFYVRDLLREAMDWLESIDERADDEPTIRLRRLYGRGILAWYLGRIDQSEQSMRACLAAATELDDNVTILACRSALAAVKYSVGELLDCRSELENVLAIAEKDDPWRWCYTLAKLIYTCRELGDNEAVQTYAQLGDGPCVADDPFLHTEWLLAAGDALMLDGDLNGARDTLEAALELTGQHGFDTHQAWAHCALGHVDALDGDWPSATLHLQGALSGFRSINVIEGELEARAVLAVALARNGELALAQRLLAEQVDAPASVFMERRILLMEAAGIVAWISGDEAEAAQQLDRARQARARTSSVPRGALAPILAGMQDVVGISA